MSTCALIEFRDGQPANAFAFGNAWGGSAFIWDVLYKKYLRDPNKEYDNWLTSCAGGDRRLWDLARRADVPMFERSVHASTFDYAIVEKKDFTQFSADLLRFARENPSKGSHLQAWSERVAQSDADRIGFMGTSVSGCLWVTWDEQLQQSIEYDFAAGTKHFSVYDDIRAEAAA